MSESGSIFVDEAPRWTFSQDLKKQELLTAPEPRTEKGLILYFFLHTK